MAFEIPVFYLDRAGRRTSDRINGEPCIEIGISWDDDAGHARIPHPRKWEKVVGLIDTGAQAIVADPMLISSWAMPWTREMNNLTSNNTTVTRGHLCQLHFPEHEWTTRQEVFSSPLRANGHNYDLLLGRVFLQSVDFSWKNGGLTSLVVAAPTAPTNAAS